MSSPYLSSDKGHNKGQRTRLIVNNLPKFLAAILLLFNGFGALYGGWNLITFPDGSSMQLSPDLLKFSPFHDFLIPGIILLVVNGIFSFVVLIAVMLNMRTAWLLVIGQGALLSGWILIQVLLLRLVYPLHLVLAFAGLALMVTGWLAQLNSVETGGSFPDYSDESSEDSPSA